MLTSLAAALAELLTAIGAPVAITACVLLAGVLLDHAIDPRRMRNALIPLRFPQRAQPPTSGVPVPRHPAPNQLDTWPYGTLLSRLDTRARKELLEMGVHRRVPAGQILIHEGTEESHLVLMCQGLAKVTVGLPDGRNALLAIRIGGDLVGEMSALNHRPRSATVTTCSPARVRFIQMDRFRRFLRDHPEAAVELAAMVADRLRWSNRQRIDFTSYPVLVRVARTIAELARAHGRRTPDGVVVDVHLTQPELATICGAAETTVQKALRELRVGRIIDTDYRKILVRDLTALRETGHLFTDG